MKREKSALVQAYKNALGATVRSFRAERKLLQKHLTGNSLFTESDISEIENGKSNMVLERLIEFFIENEFHAVIFAVRFVPILKIELAKLGINED